jgi:hypothetical protein
MSCYDFIMRWNQGCAITCMIARRIQGYIWGYICGGESERRPPLRECGVYMWLCGTVCVAGEREREGGGGKRSRRGGDADICEQHLRVGWTRGARRRRGGDADTGRVCGCGAGERKGRRRGDTGAGPVCDCGTDAEEFNSAGRRRDLGDFLTLCWRTRWLIVKPHISRPYCGG